ncbi:MAG TPA: hypothetical protein VHM24_12395 [Gemmatimonadaceae bacterium]|nr:hypothetical protein [Gemmatimonadaceae bacterium]
MNAPRMILNLLPGNVRVNAAGGLPRGDVVWYGAASTATFVGR